jgi:hypothetical protein
VVEHLLCAGPRYAYVVCGTRVTNYRRHRRAEAEIQSTSRIIFDIAHQRSVFDYTITELNSEPAKLVSIAKKRRRTKGLTNI